MSRFTMTETQVLDTIASYDQLAPELSGRATTRDLWIEGCVESLGPRDRRISTTELASSIGQNHNSMRTALPGMVALGLAEEMGIDERARVGRPSMLFSPTTDLARFVRGYNNLRKDVLMDNLPREIEQLESRELESTIIETFAAARGTKAGNEITLEGISIALRMHREAVRFRGFNSFTAAWGGLIGAVTRERDSRVVARTRD